ncbi:unnamed protein product [Caenorhabditis angaria]|uniref:Uncharacterized protein n=1 Tax=Caenorhabditis angaria TaxID=860376 RepID=A0A9P1IXR5_9PELO|nr:unnamed protein product [Caenorhabditis angaria]
MNKKLFSSSSSSSRRVSLPVSLGVTSNYISPHKLNNFSSATSAQNNYNYNNNNNKYIASPMLLSPNISIPRRSLPSTPLPNGGRRSLPPTPPTPSEDEAETEDGEDIKREKRQDRLRSFDLRDGHLLDKGFQKPKHSSETLEPPTNRYDSRRATCPDIYLFDSQNHLMRHVVLRIYGSKNCGKKRLANRIHHFATSMKPEKVVDPDENPDDFTKMTTFLLNGREITLEILLESALESSPFRQSKTIYIAMYTVDSKASFAYASRILERVVKANKSETPLQAFLIANKIDLVRNQVVSSSEGQKVSKHLKCEFVEVSALLGLNTEDTWTTILQQIQEPAERRRPSWVERLLNRGKDVAGEVFHRIID